MGKQFANILTEARAATIDWTSKEHKYELSLALATIEARGQMRQVRTLRNMLIAQMKEDNLTSSLVRVVCIALQRAVDANDADKSTVYAAVLALHLGIKPTAATRNAARRLYGRDQTNAAE